MNGQTEHEICGNCKKEIPQHNYVMHSAHCSRNFTLCQVCKELFSKSEIEGHKKSCVAVKPKVKKPEPPPTNLERSQYFQERKVIEDKKIAARKERQLQKYERLVDTGYSLKEGEKREKVVKTKPVTAARVESKPKNSSGLLACKFCDLELPKLELEEHENYCGTRTDKCLECGELVMFKYKQIHMDSNHGFLKLKDEPGPRASWDSATQRTTTTDTPSSPRPRPAPLRPFSSFDSTLYSFPATYSAPPVKDKSETYKEISRRLDCPAPLPPRRRPNPPTELTIPCEFCSVPIPHEDLIQHETGCRPDLARFDPRRRRSPELDEFFVAPQPTSPEEELPCEFCADMIPASQLLRHQATCI
ncbi:hypothetical protein Zmor_019001 [Zophobas morio]|uniref:TRAFD1/XAF1 zinc finger domain-containing protein n=1 Tax=Zophobas morio TaxID=2755281 RepID=A0AA38IFQ6_9CUCU|nr:hypothetical protein Zmor_019001 [Zophobas morio]